MHEKKHSYQYFVFLVLFLFGCTIDTVARNRVVLSNSRSITSQILSSDKGALYIVQEDIDLKKKTVKLPQDAIIKFDGGLLSNGEIVGDNATIDAGRYEIFKSVTLSGTWTLDGLQVEWFGAKPNRSNLDCSESINKAITTGIKIGIPACLSSGIYYTKSTIDISGYGTLIGLSPTSSIICYFVSSGIGVYMHGQYTTLRNVCVQEYQMERKGICIKVGDSQSKVSCTRGYVEDIKTMGGDRGLDLEYQWCNKICGVSCRYNNIGLYANATTPYVENAVIEGNKQFGIYSEGFGIKLYNAIIEGNKVGCVLNGRYNLLSNCYFEGNSASLVDKSASKNRSGVEVEGGHIYAGEKSKIIDLVMISCLIDNSSKYNNTIRIDKCQCFTAMGCSSLKNIVLTKNCTVKYIDNDELIIEQ